MISPLSNKCRHRLVCNVALYLNENKTYYFCLAPSHGVFVFVFFISPFQDRSTTVVT